MSLRLQKGKDLQKSYLSQTLTGAVLDASADFLLLLLFLFFFLQKLYDLNAPVHTGFM